MNYIITESKLEKVIIKYLNKFYGDLEQVQQSDYWGLVNFNKNGKTYIQLNTKTNWVWLPKSSLSEELVEVFNLSSLGIKDIISKWVGETYGLTNVTPDKVDSYIDYEDDDEDEYEEDEDDEENDD